jgi:hypothetical protein
VIEVRLRPLLVSGILASYPSPGRTPLILLDSEQPREQQAVAFWHEIAHLVGISDEAGAEAIGRRLAAAVPEILDIIPVKREGL